MRGLKVVVVEERLACLYAIALRLSRSAAARYAGWRILRSTGGWRKRTVRKWR